MGARCGIHLNKFPIISSVLELENTELLDQLLRKLELFHGCHGSEEVLKEETGIFT
jgi:hypothetical protein